MMKPKWGQVFRLKTNSPRKPRPVVIVSREEINGGHSVLAVPFTSQQLQKRRGLDYCEEFFTGEGGLDMDCVAKADELSMIDKLDIDFRSGPLGQLDESQMERLLGAIRWTLKIDETR